jgi:hypothetical protein
MADIDYSKYGAQPDIDYSQYGMEKSNNLQSSKPQMTIKEALQNATSIGALPGERLATDYLSGLGQAAQGLFNAPKNITSYFNPEAGTKIPSSNINVEQKLGINSPNILDKFVEGLGQFSPYGMAGKALGLGAGVLPQTGLGAAFGATQSTNPLSGTLYGAASGLLGGIPGKAAQMASDIYQHGKLLSSSPEYVNSLAQNSLSKDYADPNSTTKTLKNAVVSVYKNMKDIAAQKAEPLNNTDVRMDIPDAKTAFPNYFNSSQDLLNQKEHLNNLLGTSSDLGSKLNKELNIANNMLSNERTSSILDEKGNPLTVKNAEPVTFQDIWSRIKNLGDIGEQLSSAGHNNEARMIGNLKRSLSTDLTNNLKNTGNSDLSDQLADFNNHYANNVASFWSDPVISKTVNKRGYIPDKDFLSKALYKPSEQNQKVFQLLDPDAKNLTLYQTLTGGKGAAAGQSQMSPLDIAKKWGGFTSDARNQVASHNPEAAQRLQYLQNNLAGNHDYGITSLLKKSAEKIPVVGSLLPHVAPAGAESSLASALSRGFTGSVAPNLINYWNR